MAATIASASDPDPTSTAGSTSGESEASGRDFGFWDLGILGSFELKYTTDLKEFGTLETHLPRKGRQEEEEY